jgi:xylose dehydrogenase (NAD/NADP)
MKKIRWGLLSTAHINRRLIPAIRAAQQSDLVAVASRNLSKAQDYAATWEILQAFGSYAELLASDEVDVVYISLPNHLHAQWSIRAMQAGKHVLCEKPLALSVKDVDRMTTVSQQTGRMLMEAYMYRHHPQTKLAGEWVHSGRLGDICQVNAIFNFTITNPQDVRLAPEYGGGCLWDVGVYPVSFAQFMVSAPPQWVFGSQRMGGTGVDEYFAGQMGYPGGPIAQFSCAFRSPFYNFAEIIGTQGRLTFTRPFTHLDNERKLIFHSKDGEAIEIAVPEKELYLGEVENINQAILEGAPLHLSLSESRNQISTIEALYQSAKSQQVVSLA